MYNGFVGQKLTKHEAEDLSRRLDENIRCASQFALAHSYKVTVDTENWIRRFLTEIIFAERKFKCRSELR